MSTDHYWANSLDNSSHPVEGEKWIYLVAGSRNVITAHSQGGLWANVGQTSKSVEERLEGLDYGRKAAGGDWIVLNRWRVPDYIDDTMLHIKLRIHPGVVWSNSRNTEEFLFSQDTGDGNTASEYIRAAIMEVVMEEGRKVIAGIKSERDSLREKLKKLQAEKSRRDLDSTSLRSESPADWKSLAQKELLWKKESLDYLKSLDQLPTTVEVRNEIIFSYLFGLASVLAYFFLKPSMVEFILLFLPVSSCLSAGIGIFRSRRIWKVRLDRLKEKLK